MWSRPTYIDAMLTNAGTLSNKHSKEWEPTQTSPTNITVKVNFNDFWAHLCPDQNSAYSKCMQYPSCPYCSCNIARFSYPADSNQERFCVVFTARAPSTLTFFTARWLSILLDALNYIECMRGCNKSYPIIFSCCWHFFSKHVLIQFCRRCAYGGCWPH